MTAGEGGFARTVLETAAGPAGLVRRLVEVPVGERFEGAAGPGGELCFVIGGQGRLTAASEPGPWAAPGARGVPVRPDTGLWFPPGERYRLSADGPGVLRLDSVLLPAAGGEGAGGAAEDAEAGPRLSEWAGCPEEVTGDRRFRVLFGPGNGCEAATQFVGEIPPGRAPLHSHTYDEMVLILAGEGVIHAGGADRPLAPGTCVHLTPGTPHCLENTGSSTLRVLGVFHPGGSPASKRQEPAADGGGRTAK